MLKTVLLIIGVSSFVGIGYLTGNYIVSGLSNVNEADSERPNSFINHSNTIPAESETSAYPTIKKMIVLENSEKRFLQRLQEVNLGEELFWLAKIQRSDNSNLQYQVAGRELKGMLCSENIIMLDSIDEVLKDLPPLQFSMEKIQLLKLVMLCQDGHFQAMKAISQRILEKEIVPQHLDLDAAKNEEENEAFLASRLEINVVLNAHLVLMESAEQDAKVAWEGTKEAMLVQSGNWIKARIAQQYLKKFPQQKEVIRHELISLVGNHQIRLPSSQNEDEAQNE